MFQNLPSLKTLHAFEAAARHCSFNNAAMELSVSPGAISYQVKQLETLLKVMLFIRHTRRVELTDNGLRLYRATHRLFQEINEEIEQISQRRKEAPLTVSVSTYFVTRWLSPRMGAFLNTYPDITVRLQHSVNDPNFEVEDVDMAIRWSNGCWSRGESELLIEMPMIAVCAPSLIEDNSGIKQPSDLFRHTLLHDQPSMDHWAEWLHLAGISQREISPGPVIVDPNVRVQSAIDGQGVVLANSLVNDDIESGRLREPFNVRIEGYGYHLVFTKNATRNYAFSPFRDWLHDEAERYRTAVSSLRNGH